jgi:hypothetical protein
MKLLNKNISNLFFLAVLFALLFPLGHSFNHFFENNQKEKCVHKSYSKTNFEHKHEVNEHCSICDFNLKVFLNSSFAIEFKAFSFSFLKPNFTSLYNFSHSYIGFQSPTRGPPFINVVSI